MNPKLEKPVAEFDIQMLLPIGMTIVVFGIGIAYGLTVMEDVQEDAGAGACPTAYPTYYADGRVCGNGTANVTPTESAAWNATGDGITAVAKFPSKLGLIVTVIIAAIVIGILVRYLFVQWG